ncbi:Histidine phosphatase superfamily clade-1 [Penicillium vulpinum]|uniref:Histidine phosphatase superfamily clade-1 n=1 Tax=Penicillium vulpinum TaxID=29845 RepID=UPI002547EA45|nr:Histidine phosphatase superfamily clade-1 [Penicillium vulpinum]KAJ5959671.1 Histidine phosphatase superfamily clade-1 [Penicillium vulpinum]
MAPIIHCVRHAQGLHNLCTENHVIQDPLLTDLGHEQCQTLRENFPRHANIDLVTASPLRRTLYTALESFAPVFESKPDLKIIALPDIQEISDVACDTGSEPSVLKEEFKTGVDLDLVEEGWNNKLGDCLKIIHHVVYSHLSVTKVSGRYAPANQALKQRARAARRWLKARPEKEIVMVTHGGFLHYFTEDWEDNSQFQGTGWSNTEYRTFSFTEEKHTDDLEGYPLDGDNASLEETSDSRLRRGKTGPVPSREEQKMLYKKGIQGWGDQGLQMSIAEREAAKATGGEEVNGVRV